MKKIVTIGLVIVVIATIIFLLVFNKKKLEAQKVVVDRSRVPVPVILKTAALLPVGTTTAVPATLVANEEVNIAAAASGRIEVLALELGQTTKAQQVLGHLDVKETELKLQAAELSIEKLKRDYDRNKVLASGNALDTKTLQDSKFELDSKLLEAEQLKKQISNGRIVAPIRGIIASKNKKVDEYINTGESLGTIVDIYTLKANVYVAENQVFTLRKNLRATITTSVYPNETFQGVITYISPKGDENHNYLVELSIENRSATLKAGMYATVSFERDTTEKALQIPKTALVNGMQNPYVYINKDNKAIETKLTLGREIGENVEVLKGLSAGTEVVISGQINLVNGSILKAITTK